MMMSQRVWVFRPAVISIAAVALGGCEPASTTKIPVVKPENIVIAVDKDGNFYWNDEKVTCAELSAKMAAQAPDPAAAARIDFCGPLGDAR